jgi:hypothetical protein
MKPLPLLHMKNQVTGTVVHAPWSIFDNSELRWLGTPVPVTWF